MAHDTLRNFGYPETMIKDYTHWSVLLRPKQVTLGALVLIAKSDAQAFSTLPDGAHAELKTVTQDIESVLTQMLSYQKINYLMLMMVDPHVHFHVVPRYDSVKEYSGVFFEDKGWPAAPDLGFNNDIGARVFDVVLSDLRKAWSGA